MPKNSFDRPKPITQHFTVEELAFRWRVTADYLYRDILPTIPGVFRIGNSEKAPWRIPLSAVEQYERAHNVQVDVKAPMPKRKEP